MSPLVAEFSIWVHDEFGRDSIGPESARIDGSWPPAQARYEKLLGDWLLLWPHAQRRLPAAPERHR